MTDEAEHDGHYQHGRKRRYAGRVIGQLSDPGPSVGFGDKEYQDIEIVDGKH